MKITAFLQARTSSSRLPGKVLLDLLGQPMILRQIERIRRSVLINDLVIVTSDEPSDNFLTEMLLTNGQKVFRGSLKNVLDRYLGALQSFPCDVALRLTADCPLIDPKVIDETIQSHLRSEADYSSNSIVRKFPRGLDCEVFQPKTLERLRFYDLTAEELEHVTLGIYTRPNIFKINSYENSFDESRRRWTVDTKDDFDFVQGVYSELFPKNPRFDSQDLRELLSRFPSFENFEKTP